MSKIAFLGDVHGYAQAFQEAIDWCVAENVDSIVGLGDFVDGFDADETCVRLAKEHLTTSVCGNHDEDYTGELTRDNRDWLESLPNTVMFEQWLVTHSSPRAHRQDEYVKSSVSAWNCFDDCDFKRCVVGHSHQPMLYRYSVGKPSDSDAVDATGEGHVLQESFRYLLVNPSLAYNRSGQQNPGFSVYDRDTRKLRFVYLDLPQLSQRLSR